MYPVLGCPILTKILNFMMQSWIGVRLWMNITGKIFFSISSTGTFNTRGSKSAQIAKCLLNFVDIIVKICGIKFRSRSYTSFCSTTNTFWVIIDLVAFFAIFDKFARKRHLLRVYSKSIFRRAKWSIWLRSEFYSTKTDYNINKIQEKIFFDILRFRPISTSVY